MAKDLLRVGKGAKGYYEKELRAETSRLAAIANKRAQRLETKGLTDSPAYKSLVENGAPRFAVRGKSFNEVQREMSRVKKFLDAQTSTIRGLNQNLKDIASATGLKYKKISELQKLTGRFFELSSKVEQYLRQVDDIASAIGYQKIWEVINEYVQSEGIDLADTEQPIDEMIEVITNLIKASPNNMEIDYGFGNGFMILN